MKRSAGVLLFRRGASGIQVLLGHPGGPYFKRKDENAWSIPKGEYGENEDPEAAARREFEEETGIRLEQPLRPLGEVKQASGKLVRVWALEHDCDARGLRSNTCSIEWPPRSGKLQEFPEIDRFEWFTLDNARIKLVKAQDAFLDRLAAMLSAGAQR